ncbi:MAG: HNH endonuclease [Fusobacteriaceae bacterium]
MIYKLCSKCMTKYEYNSVCPNGCNATQKKEANRLYDKLLRKNHGFYNSLAWKKLRLRAMTRDNYICLWSYLRHNIIKQGTIVHHIIEVDEDKDKRLDIDNLITLSDEAHREIHKLYIKDKEVIQGYLLDYLKGRGE